MFKKHQCSCQRCNCIFLQPLESTYHHIELKTYLQNDQRYVIYKEKTYSVVDFLEIFKDILEYRIIELDHLTEKEQRERNIINSSESFIEKQGSVSKMQNEYSMRKEAKITQNLCCKCHLIVTIEREKKIKQTMPLHIQNKKNYVNNLKKNGCSECHFKDDDLFRYLEFDHLDPMEKIDNISVMVLNYDYTLEQLIEECRKCRILCRSCHKIHTSYQKAQGIIN